MISTRAAILFLGGLLIAGCYEGTHLHGDAGGDDAHPDNFLIETGETAPRDMPDIPDAPDPLDASGEPDACPAEYTWYLSPRQIASAALLDAAPPRLGTTQRILVEVQLITACEFLGNVQVHLIPGDATDFVGLSANAWTAMGLDCPPSTSLVPWIIQVPGRGQDNMRVVVTDENFPGGGLRLEYGREACAGPPDCTCFSDSPPGTGEEWSDCLTDCSCRPGLSCIGAWGAGGPLWSCVRPCNDFLDCQSFEECLPPVPDGVPYVCTAGGITCGTNEDCPEGFSCYSAELIGSFCTDQRELPSSTPCRCDEECPAGHRCALPIYSSAQTCEVPCLRDADCPRSSAPADAFICGEGSVCIPVD